MKKLLLFLFVGVVFIVATFMPLNSAIFFTYRSRANEDVVNIFDKTQKSVEAVRVNENLPSCVNSFFYTPISKDDLHSCLVQFTCVASAVKTFFTQPHFSCSQEGSQFICSENVIREQTKCALVDQWLRGAAITCGCGEE